MKTALSLALLPLAACTTTPNVTPLIVGEHLDARLELRSETVDMKPPAWDTGTEADREEELPTVSVRTRMLAVPPALARRILGERAGSLVSVLTTRAQTDAALGSLHAAGDLEEGAEVEHAVITLREGQTGNVSVIRQEAFVESFELVVSGDVALADPQVGVLNDGLLLAVRATTDAESGKAALDLELTLSEHERPFRLRDVSLGRGMPVQIQVPQGLVRRLTTSAVLGPQDVLVLGGAALPAGGKNVLLAFVAVEPVVME